MKQLLHITIIILLLIQPISKLWIIVSYQLNKEYIARELCVNRDKPAKCCEGKCYLNTQLAHAEEQEEKSPTSQRSIETLPFWVFCSPIPLFERVVSTVSPAVYIENLLDTVWYDLYKGLKSQTDFATILRPPVA